MVRSAVDAVARNSPPDSEYSYEEESDESPDARSCSQSDYDDDAYSAELLDVLHEMKDSLKSMSLFMAEFLKIQGTDQQTISKILNIDETPPVS